MIENSSKDDGVVGVPFSFDVAVLKTREYP